MSEPNDTQQFGTRLIKTLPATSVNGMEPCPYPPPNGANPPKHASGYAHRVSISYSQCSYAGFHFGRFGMYKINIAVGMRDDVKQNKASLTAMQDLCHYEDTAFGRWRTN